MHSDADGTLAVIAPSVDHGLIHKLVLIGNMVFSERILPTVELVFDCRYHFLSMGTPGTFRCQFRKALIMPKPLHLPGLWIPQGIFHIPFFVRSPPQSFSLGRINTDFFLAIFAVF